MRATIILILFSFLSHGMAQTNAVDDIIVLSSKGSVSYTEKAGAEDIPAIPGLRLNNEGSIFLDEGARARIVVKRRSVLLNGPGRYELSDIISNTTTKSMSFTSRFWNFVMEGMGSTDDKKDLVKYHRDYMKIHGGIKGYTQEGTAIQLLSPLNGKVASDEILFRWKIETSGGPHHFTLMNSSREVIHQEDVKGGELLLTLEKLNIRTDTKYFWSISNSKSKSEANFIYVSHIDQNVLQTLVYLEDYEDADRDERLWMKAVTLEMENYPYEADKIYRQLMADNSDNAFWKENYALFMSRQSRLEEASRLLNYE